MLVVLLFGKVVQVNECGVELVFDVFGLVVVCGVLSSDLVMIVGNFFDNVIDVSVDSIGECIVVVIIWVTDEVLDVEVVDSGCGLLFDFVEVVFIWGWFMKISVLEVGCGLGLVFVG